MGNALGPLNGRDDLITQLARLRGRTCQAVSEAVPEPSEDTAPCSEDLRKHEAADAEDEDLGAPRANSALTAFMRKRFSAISAFDASPRSFDAPVAV